MHNSEKILELRSLANQARDYQTERGWSDAQICREISKLGSTKTYKRILDPADDLDGLNVENQIKEYKVAIDLINGQRLNDVFSEKEYEDFANVVDVKHAVTKALAEDSHTSISRLVLVLGGNGTGKDVAKRAMIRKWENVVVSVEANEFWRDSLGVPFQALMKELTIRRQRNSETGEEFVLPRYPADMMNLAVQEFGKRKLILLINEAHHMGPRMWNLVKTLINTTPVVPVLLGHPVLLRRFIAGAWEETSQLIGNRMSRVVHLKTPTPTEILTLLERREVTFDSEKTANNISRTIADEAPLYGNWAFVKMVGRKAREIGKGRPLTLVEITSAFTKAKEERLVNQRLQLKKAA